jgi:hypothetical protein
LLIAFGMKTMLRSPAAADGALEPEAPGAADWGAVLAGADADGEGVAPPPHAAATSITANESAAMRRNW